jgi:hypothetical protein
MRTGTGTHFISSSKYFRWGINSKHSSSKWFLVNVKKGDILAFVKGGGKGQIVAVATFIETTVRVLGPLIAITNTNEELGWTETEGNWDIEVIYKDLYNVSLCGLYSEIKGAVGIRLYNDKCKVNLPSEYENIVRYSKVTNHM